LPHHRRGFGAVGTFEVAELDQADGRRSWPSRGRAVEGDGLRRSQGDDFFLDALALGDAGEQRLDDGAERRVTLRADQPAAVDEKCGRGGDAEAFGFGQVAFDDGAVGVVVERLLEGG
jgi:hypothetical protein